MPYHSVEDVDAEFYFRGDGDLEPVRELNQTSRHYLRGEKGISI